jgi:AcrR family transcriptional regulator
LPTGVAIRDARRHLFEAAERVLLRDGSQGLTSRAVTAEAGVAKGVLHRHFSDFDEFLAELVRDRIRGLESRAVELQERAGHGDLDENLATALTDMFGPVAIAIVGLIIFRDDLRERLRETHPTGIPLLAEATGTIESYLEDERMKGRLKPEADPVMLARMLIGSGHLMFAGSRPGTRPDPDEVRAMVRSMMAGWWAC